MRAGLLFTLFFVSGLVRGEAPTETVTPYSVERLTLPGPVAGVMVKVNLADPRVAVKVALTDDRDPDGDGPCVGQLDTTSHAARKHGFAITLNASFFAAPTSKDVLGKKVRYFVGNCSYPVGWHVAAGKLITRPANDKLRAALVVQEDGRVSIRDDWRELPKTARYAVSGNAMLLRDGKIVHADAEAIRHPRSAVGISADGKSLILLAIDGRQAPADGSGEQYSRGANLHELGVLMLRFGARDALNLDGGGSTTMVLKDPHTGVFFVANRPSDASSLNIPILVERPVADVIGITVAEPRENK